MHRHSDPGHAMPLPESREGTRQRASSVGGDQTSSSDLRNYSVRRSRFFLEHAASAGVHDVYDMNARVIGKGGFGCVRRATLKSAPNIVRAIKAVATRNPKELDMVKREVSILRSLDHPYICKIYETFHDAGFMYMVMEFLDGTDLFDYIEGSIAYQSFTESLVREIMRQVFSALHYCHQKGVVHRDVKPENIMVLNSSEALGSDSEPHIKLIDFGLASKKTMAFNKRENSFIGTFDYLPPEALEGSTVQEPSLDIWSAGMVLHALFAGGLPDVAVREGEEPLDIRDEAYDSLSTHASGLLVDLLQVDPSCRISAGEACHRCSIPWNLREAGTGDAAPNLRRASNAFAHFHRSQVLKRAILTALATQCTSGDFVDVVREFMAMDTDKNGQVSRTEMAEAIAHHLPPATAADTEHLMLSIFDALDTDGSNEIEFCEYLAAVLDEANVRCEKAMRAAFHAFDQDRNGRISVEEFSRVLDISHDEVRKHMADYDANEDGELDFEEFRTVFETRQKEGLLARSRTRRFGMSFTSTLRSKTCRLFAF